MPPRRPTINDVAARAGVSKSLVSLALRGSPKVSDESRAAIEAAAAELGYRPNAAARNLADRRSRSLGVAVFDLRNPISAEIIDGVYTESEARGYHTMLVTGRGDPAAERAEIDTLLQFQIEGLVLISHRLPGGPMEAITAECPAVIVSRHVDTVPGLDSVSNDDVAGSRMAVEHLVSLGHRRIAHVTGGDNEVAELRRRGYEQAMAEHGLTRMVRCHEGSFSDDGGYRGAVEALAGTRRPTALFVANDFAAVGALAAAQDRGVRVPEDLSIVGYDGMALAGLRSLNLTTVAQPLTELGSTAARVLLDRIERTSAEAQHVSVAPRLIVRGTSGPAPGAVAAAPGPAPL